MKQSYQLLKEHFKEISNLSKAKRLLTWDTQVMMPAKASDERAQIMASLSSAIHEKKTDPRIAEWVAEARTTVTEAWDRRNLDLIETDYKTRASIPRQLVVALETAVFAAKRPWLKAKDENDWTTARPYLEEVFALTKEMSVIKSEFLDCSPYDAQLFDYSPGNDQVVIDPLFAALKRDLPPLMHQIIEKQAALPAAKSYSMPQSQQIEIGRALAAQIGYPSDKGRLDLAPGGGFSSTTLKDGRITSRFNVNNPFASLITVMHEVGHALYSWHVPEAWNGQPVGAAPDLLLHESQSLIMQRHIGQNPLFMPILHATITAHDPDFANQISVDDLRRTLHQVKASFIRTEADEVTYPLHVVVRYDIEKALFAGQMTVADLPEVWNTAFKDMLGLDVPNDTVGCLQNKHWFTGKFGYFPTYAQGALYAAQFYAAIQRDVPDLDNQIAADDVTAFNDWLHRNVHAWGQFYTAPELVAQATGEAPTARYYLDHIKQRYLSDV